MKSGQIGDVLVSFHFMRFRARVLKLGVLGSLLLLLKLFLPFTIIPPEYNSSRSGSYYNVLRAYIQLNNVKKNSGKSMRF
jgi:hypothetical protein